MKYKMFSGQGAELEKKINDWLTPNMELRQVGQSTISATIGDKTVPYTIVSIFFRKRGSSKSAIWIRADWFSTLNKNAGEGNRTLTKKFLVRF